MRREILSCLILVLAWAIAGCGGGKRFVPDEDASDDPLLDAALDATADAAPDADPGDPSSDEAAECGDADGDGVCDEDDVCPGGDDTVDTDGDTVPDACDCEGLTCGDNAHCEDGEDGPTCVCDEGYAGDGHTCTPIDHCSDGTDSCDTNATCTYTGPGTYTCTCNSGYTGDGYSCTPIDHCSAGTDSCDTNATCTYTGPGTYTCTCNSGYTGDGFTCTPVTTRCDTFSEAFTTMVPSTAQCTIFDAFRTGLATSGYVEVTMSGSLDSTGITCTDSTAAQAIANALRTSTSAMVTCDGHTWAVCDRSGTLGPYTEIWIDPPSLCSGSNCPNPGRIIRPCIGNSNWGGVASRTCSGPSQTMTLEFCF
ncbi:MAG: hypothetical protein JRG91_10705 [Deltaproteobacteria bacterium]|nr:hypothetical protein [Deltaproteobacteria bacterium]